MISISNLSKKFGDSLAVDGISFDVNAGEVVGVLGPNGAGKSTTMKMLTGFLSPSSGQILIDGVSIFEQPVLAKKKIGYLSEGAPTYEEMTPLQYLHFIAQIRQLPKNLIKEKIHKIISQVELEDVMNKSISHLSKGYKRRVGLAQALIHDPEILILDEPTDGLDPNQKHQVRQLITSLSKEKIVIVSTHILDEILPICHRVIMIHNGKLIFDDSPLALQKLSKYYQAVTLRFNEPAEIDFLIKLGSADEYEYDENTLTLTLFPKDASKLLSDVNHWMLDHANIVDSIFVESGRLDQVFRSLTHQDTK